MSYDKKQYLLLKFYLPQYNIQGKPIPFLASEVNRRGIDWAVIQARDMFLESLHQGTIHKSHARLWIQGKVTWDAKLRKLDPDQLSALRSASSLVSRPRYPKRVGWKRIGDTAKERRERWFKNLA